jgi:hypothetical protein
MWIQGAFYYVVYHIVGFYVGCTENYGMRKLQHISRLGNHIQFEILDLVSKGCEDQFAGDQERFWQSYFGYKKGAHFKARWTTTGAQKASLSSSQNINKQGKSGFQTGAAGRASAVSFHHVSGFKTLTPDQRKQFGKASLSSPTHVSKTSAICPHCLLNGQLRAMKRWHFDNCWKIKNPITTPCNPLKSQEI